MTCTQSAIPTENISNMVSAIILDSVTPSSTVTPQHQATLRVIVTIDQTSALAERNSTHSSTAKIITMRKPKIRSCSSTSCIWLIMVGSPTG